MGQIGKTIAAAGGITLSYGEGLLKGIKADQFARQPKADGKLVNCNHPAFVYGHLAIYASRMMELMGRPAGVAAKPAGWDELFKNGVECKDDPTGKIYPPMETISRHFIDGYKAVLAALPEVDDSVFMKPNPMGGRMTEMLPTIGAAVNFLMTGHPMSHLGQASTWRRCMGMGSAF